MQVRNFLYLGYLYVIVACNLLDSKDGEGQKKPQKKMTYSYACLDSSVSGNDAAKAISKTTSLIRNLAIKEKDITDSMQNDYGRAFHEDAIETGAFKLLDDKVAGIQLQKVLDDLLKAREKPSAINYSIYLLESDEINAFTFGGRIYITKAMYEKCKSSTSLLYSIIGHEIGHSEKGHIKKTIQEMMITENIFGPERGVDAFQILKLMTGSFNQKNELEADYYGTDLAYQLDYDVCAAVDFWQQMSRQENQYSRLEDFFRTHPFSNLRYQCLKDHIQTNFGKTCLK
jgi:beta-barrel assembly-enhancing protease